MALATSSVKRPIQVIPLVVIGALCTLILTPISIPVQGQSTKPSYITSDPRLWFRTYDPQIFVWSNVIGQYNPYDALTAEDLGEYLIGDTRINSKTEIYLMMYEKETLIDPEIVGDINKLQGPLQKQNLAKEYYWRFYNESGVLPSMTWINTTFKSINQFTTRKGDHISYLLKLNPDNFHRTKLTVPAFDLKIEVPANSGTTMVSRTFLDLPSWGFTRWRLSDAPLVLWPDIKKHASFDRNSAGKLKPSPEFFRRLHAPCVMDMFAFYILTSDSNGQDHLFVNIPLMKDDHWMDVSPSFCNSATNPGQTAKPECRFERKTPILLTNNHLLVLTSKGLFVSGQLSFSDARLTDPYLQKPLLPFHLVNPCAELEDVVVCFGEAIKQTASSIRMFYNPVCHLHQHPNFRDTAMLMIKHTRIGQYTNSSSAGKRMGPSVAFTIVYADAPYTEWHILLKSISEFGSAVITDIPGIFYNHQLNQFDIVITVREHGGAARKSIRNILHRPKVSTFYYTELASYPQKGFQGYEFESKFKLTGMQVTPSSMDIFFYGNQLYIAESAGFLVYQALGEVFGGSVIESCSFGHPDRFYLCTNKGNTVLLVGRVGTFYAPAELYPHKIPDIEKLLIRRSVLVPIDETWSDDKKTAYQIINNARMIEFFRNAHFTISHGGFLMMWYMKSVKVSSSRDPFTLRFYEVAADEAESKKLAKAYEGEFVKVKQVVGKDTIVRMEIDVLSKNKVEFSAEARDGPLVPYLLDPVSCAFYEAVLPETPITHPTYLERVHVGLDLICMKKDANAILPDETDCEMFIRHIKLLRFLPEFNSAIFTYVVKPIPMQPFHCDAEIRFLYDNKVLLTFGNSTVSGANGTCWLDDYIGWTLFMPGHYSVLLEGATQNLTNCTCTSSWSAADCICVDGRAIRQSARLETHTFKPYQSALIDMSTPLYKKAQNHIRNLNLLIDPKAKRSWDVKLDNCNFELKLSPNPILQGSGGHVYLDLQDFFTYKVRLVAIGSKARVMLQRTLISLTNSNPLILNVDRNFDRKAGYQEMVVVARASGVGTGIATVTVRSTACSLKCKTPCSFTIVFQLMRREGGRILVDYPVMLPPKAILASHSEGIITDMKGNALYRRLPINYRPPSRRGNAIPLSKNIYNADPSKPKYANTYQISKRTGEFGKCKGKTSAKECDCSPEDRLNDHPEFTDCRQMVYVIRRGLETQFRSRYPPLMKDKDQNPVYFLNKTHLSVVVEEINGRTEYSISSSADEYLRDINSDKELNLGHRYYDANSLRITCFASGLYHFKATLGEFDSFDHVAGYFMFLCEEAGINSITYAWVLLMTICIAFLLLFFAFLHLRKRLLKHIPLQGETDKIKME